MEKKKIRVMLQSQTIFRVGSTTLGALGENFKWGFFIFKY